MLKLDLARPPRWLSALAEEAEAKLAHEQETLRRKLATELETMDKRLETETRALTKEVEKLQVADAEAQAAAKATREALSNARGNLFVASLAHEHRSGVIRKQLRELADPRINAARQELMTLFEREHAIPSRTESQDTGQVTRGGIAIRNVLSNRASVKAREAAMLRAINELEALKERPVPDVAKAIAEIRASIPERGGLELVAENVTA